MQIILFNCGRNKLDYNDDLPAIGGKNYVLQNVLKQIL